MPGRNGMGPTGQGPMTGGGRGWCGGANAREDIALRGSGFGMGRGNGRGGGWRHRYGYYATGLTGWQRAQLGWPGPGVGFEPAVPAEQELASLKEQAASIEQMLGELKSRIEELAPPTSDPTGTQSK
jgi:hypothetical protein